MRPLPAPPLLLITDRRSARKPLEQVVQAALHGGCRWISLREKDLPAAERVALLRALLALARPFGAAVMIHEDVEAAAAAGADGVHLPAGGRPYTARQQLGPGVLIGISTHSVAEAAAADKAGADYATLSPIYPTDSKPGYGPPLGVNALTEAAASVTIPILALGGIDAERVAACRSAGAAGVAVMGTVMTAEDPAAVTAGLVTALAGSDNAAPWKP